RKKIDVLHIGDMASWALALAIRLRFSKARILVSAHGTDVAFQNRSGLPAYLYGAYLKLGVVLLPENTVIIANSSATADIVKTIGFELVKVVPLATDISVKEINTIKTDTLFFAGRLIPRKGLGWFVNN